MMIVFDLDDTLYKEADYVRSGCQAIAKAVAQEGIMAYNTALEIITDARDTASGFDNLSIAARSISDTDSFNIGKILEIYRNHHPSIKLDDDTRGLLNKLHDLKIPIGLITDGRSTAQRAKIQALGLTEFISPTNILISSEIGADKHSSLPFEMMMRNNPTEKRFIYVGDNPEKDFLWPNRLGWTTIMLLDQDNRNIHRQINPPKSDQHSAMHTITQLHDILEYL